MGEITELSDQIHKIKVEINDEIMPIIREAQAKQHEAQEMMHKGLVLLVAASNKIETGVAHLFMSVVEEVDGEGGPKPNPRKRATLADAMEAAAEPQKVAKIIAGSGKRACSNCRQTGHRATTCTNPKVK